MPQAYFLTRWLHLRLSPEEWLYLYPAGGCLPTGVSCLSLQGLLLLIHPVPPQVAQGPSCVGRKTHTALEAGQRPTHPSGLITAFPALPDNLFSSSP